jgi:hypothetical protein
MLGSVIRNRTDFLFGVTLRRYCNPGEKTSAKIIDWKNLETR